MSDNVPNTPEGHRRHRVELLDRIRTALEPATDREHATIEWLALWDLEQLEDLAQMAERARRREFAEGAEIGRSEVSEETGRHQSASDDVARSWGDL